MDIIVCNYNGAFVCKYLDKKNRQLLSSNASHKPVSITPEDEFTIEGIIAFSIRVHRSSPLLLP